MPRANPHYRKMPPRDNEIRKVGRPQKLTPEVQARIVQSVSRGNYFEIACAAAGIRKDTGVDWLRKGARGEGGPKFKEFSLAIEKAEAHAEQECLDIINMAARGMRIGPDGKPIQIDKPEWCAAAWKLERKHPDRWARTERLQLSGPNGGPVSFAAMAEQIELEDQKENAIEIESIEVKEK